MKVRRVVTAHDANGKAVVAIDEISTDVKQLRVGATTTNLWSTVGFPVDNSGRHDGAKDITGTTRAGGTVFRVIEFAPGVTPRNHRTDSIDYAIVLVGEVYAIMEKGEKLMKAGDVLIQRGTNHAWSNRSGKLVRILYVLMDGEFDDELGARFKAK